MKRLLRSLVLVAGTIVLVITALVKAVYELFRWAYLRLDGLYGALEEDC